MHTTAVKYLSFFLWSRPYPAMLAVILAFALGVSGCTISDGSEPGGGGTGATLVLPETLSVRPESKQITFEWALQDDFTYDLYWSTDPDFDPDNAASSEMAPNISSPLTIDHLNNDQNYYFYLTASRGSEKLTSPRFDARIAAPGVDRGNTGGGGISAVAQSNDGRLFVGGNLNQIGHSYGRLQVIDEQFGHQRAHPQVNERVSAVTSDGQGGYYFATISPTQIRRVDADGHLYDNFNVSASSDVLTMLVHNNTLYVGGQFSTIGGAPRPNLAALTPQGDVLGWTPSPDGDIRDLAVHNNILYAVGDFTNSVILGEEPRSNAAAFDLNNNRTLTDWAPEPDYDVYAVSILDNQVVLGGDFENIAGIPRVGLAIIDLDGNPTDLDLQLNGEVTALAVHGSQLYVAGDFTAPKPYLFRMNLDGTLDNNWPAHAPNRAPNALVVTDNGAYVGGNINAGENSEYQNLVKYLPNGQLDNRIGYGVDRRVFDLMISDGRLIVAGEALIRIEENKRGLAVLDLDGRWLDFPAELDGTVNSLSIHQGKLYVGGQFELANALNVPEPVARSGVAVFDLDSAELQPFAPQLSHSSQSHQVFRILPMDGDYVIAGRFDDVNGAPRQGLVRVNGLGDNATPIAGTDSANGRIHALALTDNHLYVAGNFSGLAGNANAEHIARIHRVGDFSGDLDSTWLPEISANNFPSTYGVVNDIAIQGGRVHLIGSFTEFDSVSPAPRLHLAAIETNGTLTGWTSTLSGPGSTRGHNLLFLPGEDAFLITGTFNNVDGSDTGRAALIDRASGDLKTSSTLSMALGELKLSDESYRASLNQATGNTCISTMRHEEAERLRVGILCMDFSGNLLW